MFKQNNKYVEIYRLVRLNEILEISSELKEAYNLKEKFLRITTYVKCKDAKQELKKGIEECKKSKIQKMIKAAKLIENWLDEIVNSFKNERYSNGFTEANNNTINKIVNRAYGYKNYIFFRLNALAILHQGYFGGNRENIKKGRNKIL